jgi:methionyl-tRNA formyltransferase
MKKFIIGYFGDGPWSHGSINKLLSDETLEIAFVCARSDKIDQILKETSLKNGIEFFSHPRVNSPEFLSQLATFDCDLFVSMSYNQIFKKQIIDLPKNGIINCHAGKLPFYRGRNILNWVLINGEKEFGITTHFVDEGIDTGDIILQRAYPIKDTDDYSILLAKAYLECPEILYDSVKLIQRGSFEVKKQIEIDPIGLYCVRRISGDEHINWNQSSRDVFNFVRALSTPGPRARTFLSRQAIFVDKVEMVPDARNFKGIPGAILSIEREGFSVKTNDSFIRVLEWSGTSELRVGDRLS